MNPCAAKMCPACRIRPRKTGARGTLLTYCLDCEREKRREWYKKAMQDDAKKDKLAKSRREWHVNNPEKWRESKKRYLEKHPGKARQFRRSWHAKNPDKYKLYMRAWRKANPEEWKKLQKRWYEKNYEKVQALGAARRAHRLNAKGVDKTISIASLCERDDWRCHICGCKIEKNKRKDASMGPSIDHVIPLSKGGSHTWQNVRIAHRSCNSRKGNRPLKQKNLPIGE